MTMPSYIINWDDMLRGFNLEESLVLLGSLRDLESKHRIQGVAQNVPNFEARYMLLEVEATERTALTEITYSQSSYHPEDYWELWVDGDRILETVYTREMGVTKHWETIHYVNEGQIIRLVHHNNSGTSKDISVDLGYAGGIEEVKQK